MIGRIGPVDRVSGDRPAVDATVYRNDHIPARPDRRHRRATRPGSTCSAPSARPSRSGSLAQRRHARYPAVVLGAKAAQRLGITVGPPDQQVWLGGRWFTVVGILDPVPLAAELDPPALVGWPAAAAVPGLRRAPDHRLHPDPAETGSSRSSAVLAATANPEHPNEVQVSRPSDALAAKQATDATFTGAAARPRRGGAAGRRGRRGQHDGDLGAGAPRPEIGLRRSLGATRGQIRVQFLAESLLLSALGGVGGVLLGHRRHRRCTPPTRAGRRWCRPGPSLGRRRRDPGHRRGRRPLPGDPGRPPVPDRGARHGVTGALPDSARRSPSRVQNQVHHLQHARL